ncbi:MAG TPA: hypothetical protein PLN52_23395 [Opitutaceae bacterium]|nr:hypothetical protein [Opitutaceae bacterium]
MSVDTKKLEAMVDNLVSSYLSTVFDFRVLEPMLYRKDVIDRHGRAERAPGFASIRFGLYYHLILECWKLACDDDDRSYSVRRIRKAFNDTATVSRLRHEYGNLQISIDQSVDPHTRAVFEQINQEDRAKRESEFDTKLDEFRRLWDLFLSSPQYTTIDKARKKVAAHSEVTQSAGGFRAKDLSDVGIKWGHERLFIEDLREIVDLVNHLVRRAGLTWSQFDEQTKRDALNFWK